MTGAGRLSSGPQPVTANAAPLCLSCTVDRGPRCRGISVLAAPPVRDGSPKGEKPGVSRGFSDSRQPGPKGRRPYAREQDAMSVQAPGSLQLDFLASLCLRVIDTDLEHGKTLLQLFPACLGSVPGRKFSLESAVDFERIT
jgi:hypothetical protein